MSFFEPPALRRRCLEIQIQGETPGRFEATIVSRKWTPNRVVRRMVGSLPGFRMARALRRVFGKRLRTKLVVEVPSGGDGPVLQLGPQIFKAKQIRKVALQGWQESVGMSRVWDVMLLGPNKDVLVGHKSYDAAYDFATKLAERLGVDFEESSVVGGSTEAPTAKFNTRDAHYDAIRWDGYRR